MEVKGLTVKRLKTMKKLDDSSCLVELSFSACKNAGILWGKKAARDARYFLSGSRMQVVKI